MLAAPGFLQEGVGSVSRSELVRRVASVQPNFTTCDCGFIDSYDPAQAVYTNYYRVDFTDSSYTRANLTSQFRLSNNDVDARSSGGKYIRHYSPGQVALSSSGVELTVSPVSASNTTRVPVAGVYAKAYDWGFGSYHLQAEVTSIVGTVSAFFVYGSSTSAAVMEYVSKPNWGNGSQFIRDTVAPQIYDSRGNPSTKTYGTTKPKSQKTSFSSTVHNWGFSWRPASVTYGLDNTYSTKLTTNVPQTPGLVAFSSWSDGNPNYSQGPPKSNATFTVEQLWVVHNATVNSGAVNYNALVNGVYSTTPVMTCQKRKKPCYVGSPGGDSNGLSLTRQTTSAAIKRSASSASTTGPVGTALALWLLAFLIFSLQ